MTTQLLFYGNVAPVSKQKHADWSVQSGSDYAFAREVNSVPIMTVEIRQAAFEYPVVFAENGGTILPAVILGVRNNQNLYVTEGSWNARYVPAFVRRYPFVFSSTDAGATFTLCIDESYAGCNSEGRGERLFDDDGERTPFLDGVLNFVNSYQREHDVSLAFCRQLKELELLEPMQAQVKLPSGGQSSLTGFLGVSREKLKSLDGEQLVKLVANDALELVYLHLESLNNFTRLFKREAEAGAKTG